MKTFIAAFFALALSISAAYAVEPVTFLPLAGSGKSVAYTATDNDLSSITGFVDVVRVVCTTDCFISVEASGKLPEATASTGMFLPALTPEYIRIPNGAEISAIRLNTNGTLYVTEVAR